MSVTLLASQIKLVRSHDPDERKVVLNNVVIGRIHRPSLFKSTGWFIELDGIKWSNAATGARYTQERDFKAPKAFVKTQSEARERIAARLSSSPSQTFATQ